MSLSGNLHRNSETHLQLTNTLATPCHPCLCCCRSWRFLPMVSLLQVQLNCVLLLLAGKPTGRGSHEIISWASMMHTCPNEILDDVNCFGFSF